MHVTLRYISQVHVYLYAKLSEGKYICRIYLVDTLCWCDMSDMSVYAEDSLGEYYLVGTST